MTTDIPDLFDMIAERDREHAARRDSVADHRLADADFDRFMAAIRSAADALGAVSQNDVRPLLFEDTVDGPRCSIKRERYAGFFSRACREGWLSWEHEYDTCTTSPTGNNNKPQRLYRLVAA